MSGRVLTFATVCSGIECMSVASRGLPLRPVFFSEIEPFPCAVLKAHYPDVPNLGDMSKISVTNKTEITNGTVRLVLDRPIDILAGGTPCFVAGTMVLTPKGYVPIESLRVGDEVVGGSGAVRKVEAVGSRMAEVGRIKILGRPEITCTPNHPFMCVGMKRDNRRKSPTYSRKIAAEADYAATRADKAAGKYVGRINHGRMTAYKIAYPKCGNATCDDIMELAGWYLGDGYIRRFKGKTKKCVVFALCCEKKIAMFNNRFGGIFNFCNTGKGKIAICCTALADWLVANFGEHAAEKRIPYWCYDRENTHRLLQGYAATDGWTQGNERKFCTVSPALAYGMADLLGKASVYRQKVPPKGMIQGREVNQRDYYQVKVTPRTIRTKYINGRYASIVRNYEATGTVQRVYNITVSDEHTYIADGIYTHNCQDVSVAGKRAGMSEGSGTRSSLAFDFVRLARELGPRYVIWENVAGSIDRKNAPDFLRFVSALGDCGYSLAWRVLDAQYVRVDGVGRAVPQRRRRVWVVGYFGDDESRAAQILFESDCVAGNTPPRRSTGQGFAYTLGGRDSVDAGLVGGAPGTDPCGGMDDDGGCVSCTTRQISLATETQCSGPIISTDYKEPQCIALGGDKLKPREDQRKGGNGFGVNEDGAGYTVTATDRHGVAYGYEHYEAGGVKTLRKEVEPCLSAGYAGSGHNNSVVQCYENHAQDYRVKPIEVSDTRNQKDGTCGNNLPLVVHAAVAQNSRDEVRIVGGDGQVAGALAAEPGMKQQTYVVSTNSNGEEIAPTLTTSTLVKQMTSEADRGGGYVVTRVLGIGRDVIECGKGAKFSPDIREGVQPTLTAKATQGAVCVEMKQHNENE